MSKEIKFKDLFTISKNKSNNQMNFSLKKKKLKSCGLKESDIFNISIQKKFKRFEDG